MVGEKATTDITIAKDAKGFPQLKYTAKEGGVVAKSTRDEIERRTGKSILSKENFLQLAEKKKKHIEDMK